MAELFGLDKEDLPEDAYPLRYSTLEKYQQKDQELIEKAKKIKIIQSPFFMGEEKSINS